MLVLLSFGLVLVATVLLVLGLLVGDGLTLIYASIALSVGAAVLLIVAVRLAKPKGAGAAGPAPLAPEPSAATAPADRPRFTPAPTREPVAAGNVPAPASTGAPTSVVPPPPAPTATDAVPEATGGAWLASDDEWSAEESTWSGEGDDDGDEIAFPIADYDELTVEQIMPLLPQLYSDEIDVVEAREVAGQNRPEILAELARLREEGTLADGELDTEVGPAAVPGDDAAPAPGADDAYPDEPVEDEEFEAFAVGPVEDVVVDEVPAPEPVTAGGVDDDGAWDDDDLGLPIEDYDSLSYGQIVALLGELDDEELAEIRAHEAANKGRQTVIADIDRRLGASPAAAAVTTRAARKKAAPEATAPVPARKKAAAKKAPSSKKAATKKAAAVVAPLPAKKKAAVKKAAATPLPVKKLAAKKKAAAVTAKKAAAPARKATKKR